MIKQESPHSVTRTLDRLQAALEAEGVQIMARVRHHQNAEKVELSLRPTELLIFGSPAVGTQLMLAEQSVGIDLPLKALAWEEADGTVWLAYNDPGWIARRHGIDPDAAAVAAMRRSLESFTRRAIAPE